MNAHESMQSDKRKRGKAEPNPTRDNVKINPMQASTWVVDTPSLCGSWLSAIDPASLLAKEKENYFSSPDSSSYKVRSLLEITVEPISLPLERNDNS